MSEAAEKIEDQEIEAPEKPKAEERVLNPVAPSRVLAGEFGFNTWRVWCYPGTTVKDLETEEYWNFVSRQFKRGDRIEALTDDMTTCFEAIVLAAGDKWAQIQVLKVHNLKINAAEDIVTYTAEWGGPSHRYRVKRGDEVIKHGLDSMKDAKEWIKQRRIVDARK